VQTQAFEFGQWQVTNAVKRVRKLEKQLLDILSLVHVQAVRLWTLSPGNDPAAA